MVIASEDPFMMSKVAWYLAHASTLINTFYALLHSFYAPVHLCVCVCPNELYNVFLSPCFKAYC